VITPRIHRRSLRNALQWRLLLLWWASLLLPGAVVGLPIAFFLGSNLDHSTRAKEAVAWMDGSTLVELVRRLGEENAFLSLRTGFAGAVLTLFFIAPFTAGALVSAARSDEPLSLQRLLAGAGEMYGRMLRLALCALLPLGIGAGLGALAIKIGSKASERAIWETDGHRAQHTGLIVAALFFFLFHLLVDTARAHFAAEPTRRSAAVALWSAVKLLVRRPLRVLAVGAVGSVVGLGLAAVFMAVRLRVEQAGIFSIAMAWLLAQAAQLAVGWGKGTRIFGLAELVRADAADRSRAFRMEPPASSPPAVVESETLDALAPPAASQTLSPPSGSGT
jgi:hypothetical protein